MMSLGDFGMMQPAMIIVYILAFVLFTQFVFYVLSRLGIKTRKQKLILPMLGGKDLENGGKNGLKIQKSDSETKLAFPPPIYSLDKEIAKERIQKSTRCYSRNEPEKRNHQRGTKLPARSNSLYRSRSRGRTTSPVPTYRSIDRSSSRRRHREDTKTSPNVSPVFLDGDNIKSLSPEVHDTFDEGNDEFFSAYTIEEPFPKPLPSPLPSLARSGMLDILKRRADNLD
jgi:hypothetical protein